MRTARTFIARSVLASLLSSLFVVPLVVTGCGSDNNNADAEPFDTLQDCFDDHHNVEHLTIKEALVVCCVDHPIGDQKLHPSCGDTLDACKTHVRDEIDVSVTDTDIGDACADYLNRK
jgi:hypothetical protein